MTIKIIETDIRIRPSAVTGFYNCSYQWGKTFLEGIRSIPGARAAIGTSVHKGAEVFWTDAMSSGKKDANMSALTDAAMEAFKEETHDGVQYDEGENANTAQAEIIKGVGAFVTDIAEFTPIPDFVEHFLKVDIDHPLVKEVGGTIDYGNKQQKTIADLKTSKRKPTVANYEVQQSIYKFLAQQNNFDVEHNLIQSVVLGKTETSGMVLPLQTNVDKAKYLVNNMLDVLEIVAADKIPAHHILRGNPGYYLCSPKYCAHYKTCPFVNGDAPKPVTKAIAL